MDRKTKKTMLDAQMWLLLKEKKKQKQKHSLVSIWEKLKEKNAWSLNGAEFKKDWRLDQQAEYMSVFSTLKISREKKIKMPRNAWGQDMYVARNPKFELKVERVSIITQIKEILSNVWM